MNGAVFVDTNVFVYARDASEKHKQAAAMAWIERLWREQRGRTSMQVLSEYYVTVTRKLKPGLSRDDAWDDIGSLSAWKPRATDLELLTAAHEVERRHQLSWWDALIVAAAQLQNCSLLLTEDLHDGAVIGGLAVMNPFTSKVKEEQPAYGVAPKSNPRHRRPGRPVRR